MNDADETTQAERPTMPPTCDYASYIEQEVALSTHPYYTARDLARDYVRAVIGDDVIPENPLPMGCEGRPL